MSRVFIYFNFYRTCKTTLCSQEGLITQTHLEQKDGKNNMLSGNIHHIPFNQQGIPTLPTRGSLTNGCNPPAPSSRAHSSGFLRQTLAAKILSTCAKISTVLAVPNPTAYLSVGGYISNYTSSNLLTKSNEVSLNVII